MSAEVLENGSASLATSAFFSCLKAQDAYEFLHESVLLAAHQEIEPP